MVQRKDIKTEDIVHLYVNEKLIGKEIAALLECSIPLVQQRLKRAGIKMRPSNERITLNPPPKEALHELYWDHEFHPSTIGKFYGVSFSTIVNWMKEYAIPFRTKSQARKGKMNPIYGVGHSEETKEKMSRLFLEGRRTVSVNNQYGNYTEYNGTTYRSTWEAGTAFYFSSIKIPFFYEKDAFEYKDEFGRTRVYTPDFYLPSGIDNDGVPLYIEVKGRFMERDHLKLDAARNQGNTVLLWDWNRLQELGIINAAGKVIIGGDQLKKVGK